MLFDVDVDVDECCSGASNDGIDVNIDVNVFSLELMDFDEASNNSEHPLLACMLPSGTEGFSIDYASAITHSGFIVDLVKNFQFEITEVCGGHQHQFQQRKHQQQRQTKRHRHNGNII